MLSVPFFNSQTVRTPLAKYPEMLKENKQEEKKLTLRYFRFFMTRCDWDWLVFQGNSTHPCPGAGLLHRLNTSKRSVQGLRGNVPIPG